MSVMTKRPKPLRQRPRKKPPGGPPGGGKPPKPQSYQIAATVKGASSVSASARVIAGKPPVTAVNPRQPVTETVRWRGYYDQGEFAQAYLPTAVSRPRPQPSIVRPRAPVLSLVRWRGYYDQSGFMQGMLPIEPTVPLIIKEA